MALATEQSASLPDRSLPLPRGVEAAAALAQVVCQVTHHAKREVPTQKAVEEVIHPAEVTIQRAQEEVTHLVGTEIMVEMQLGNGGSWT